MSGCAVAIHRVAVVLSNLTSDHYLILRIAVMWIPFERLHQREIAPNLVLRNRSQFKRTLVFVN